MNKKMVLARTITDENFMKDIDLYVNQVCKTYGKDNTLTLDDRIDFVEIIVDMIGLILKCKDENEVNEHKIQIYNKGMEVAKTTIKEEIYKFTIKSHFNSIFNFIINTYKINNDLIMECLNIKSNMLSRYKNNTAYIQEKMLCKLIVEFNINIELLQKEFPGSILKEDYAILG